jgi:6-phosphogluconolactonase (cycloisomerase 2 family)
MRFYCRRFRRGPVGPHPAILLTLMPLLLPLLAGCGGDSGGSGGSQQMLISLDKAAKTLSQFAAGANGPVPLTTASVPTGDSPSAMASDPQGQYVYVVNSGDNTVSQFQVTASGLTPLSPATVQTGPQPAAIFVHPNGKYVYVVNAGDNTISQFVVSGRGPGSLEPNLDGATVAFPGFGGGPSRRLIMERLGQYMYLLMTNLIVQFIVNQNGTLALLNPATVFLPAAALAIAINTRGPSLYVLLTSAVLLHMIILSNGQLVAQAGTPPATGPNPTDVAVDPGGTTIAVTNSGDSTVSHFAMDNGNMVAVPSVRPTVVDNPVRISFTATDGDVLVLGGQAVGQYKKTTASVPVLGDIPVIGNLFKSRATTRNNDELLVFVTPAVLQTAE